MHERAVDAAMEIECKKDSLRQNQDGTWKLVLTVAPDGLPDAVMKAAPGTRYVAVFVEVGDNEEPVKRPPAAPEKAKVPFKDKPLSAQAGIRCADPMFMQYLNHLGYKNQNAEQAAGVVRLICGVDSRKEFDTRGSAGSVWMGLDADFEQWGGRVTEQR